MGKPKEGEEALFVYMKTLKKDFVREQAEEKGLSMSQLINFLVDAEIKRAKKRAS